MKLGNLLALALASSAAGLPLGAAQAQSGIEVGVLTCSVVPGSRVNLLVRTADNPLDLVPVVRDVVKSIDRDLPLGQVTTADALMDDALQGTRFNTVLLGLFAGVALVLAAVGIYGVVSWNVTQRTKEIGIRQALGADRASVLRLVILQSMRVACLDPDGASGDGAGWWWGAHRVTSTGATAPLAASATMADGVAAARQG